MTNEEKAKELANFLYFKLSYIDYGTLTEKFLEVAEWKEQQMISQMKEFIAEYFYEHPHTSLLICSDEFQDLNDCFERLERYLKEE